MSLLFTPRLYMYRGLEGITLEYNPANQVEIFGMYSDLMYCAALNHWTLTHTADEVFPYKRIDFHALSVNNRKEFNEAMVFALQTLSGKSMKELIENAAKAKQAQETKDNAPAPEDVKKKRSRGSIMTRLKNIWSAIVD